jgi:hypothetical protein
MEVEIDKFETIRIRGSLVRNVLTKSYRYFIGGKENIRVTNMRIGFSSVEQVDTMIDQLLEVRKKLEK